MEQPVNLKEETKNPENQQSDDQQNQSIGQMLSINEHKLSNQEILDKFNLSSIQNGLTSQQAESKLQEEGQNVQSLLQIPPWYYQIQVQFFSLFTVLVLVVSGLFLAHFYLQKQDRHNLYIGITLLVGKILSAFILYFKNRPIYKMLQMKRIQKYKEMYSIIRDGCEQQVPSYQLVPGDVILLTVGLEIPAEVRIITSNQLAIDMQPLTGQQHIKKRSPNYTSENPLETENLLFQGSVVKAGVGVGVVIKTGRSTLYGQILYAIDGDQIQIKRYSNLGISDEIKTFVQIVSFVGFIVIIMMYIRGVKELTTLRFVVYISCLIIGNITLSDTNQIIINYLNLYIKPHEIAFKDQSDLETFTKITCVCCEKSGILTQLFMKFNKVFINGCLYDIPEGKNEIEQESQCFKLLQLNSIFNSNLLYEQPKYNQFDVAKLEFFTREQIQNIRSQYQVQCNEKGEQLEIKFHTQNKYHCKIIKEIENSEQSILIIQGIENLLKNNFNEILRNEKVEQLSQEEIQLLQQQTKELNDQGGRVIFYGYQVFQKEQMKGIKISEIEESINNGMQKFIFIGYIYYYSDVQPKISEIVERYRENNIKLIMMSGDQVQDCVNIAKQIGILGDKTNLDLLNKKQYLQAEKAVIENECISETQNVVIDGVKLESQIMEDKNKPYEQQTEVFDKWLGKQNIIFARISPEMKCLITEACQRLRYSVAVVCNQTSDLLPMKIADFGVALMGSSEMVHANAQMLAKDFICFSNNLINIRATYNSSFLCSLLHFLETPFWLMQLIISLGIHFSLMIMLYQQAKAIHAYF